MYAGRDDVLIGIFLDNHEVMTAETCVVLIQTSVVRSEGYNHLRLADEI